jgi:hypothetical protein
LALENERKTELELLNLMKETSSITCRKSVQVNFQLQYFQVLKPSDSSIACKARIIENCRGPDNNKHNELFRSGESRETFDENFGFSLPIARNFNYIAFKQLGTNFIQKAAFSHLQHDNIFEEKKLLFLTKFKKIVKKTALF